MLRELQQSFRHAVTTADDGQLPAHVAAPRGRIASRIDIYRTTVQASLTDVLATAFPVVTQIVGPAFFAHLAATFIAVSPPRVPQLSRYGDGFAAFVATFPAAASLPYLADVARLEWARAESYFAADAMPLDPAALQHVTVDGVIQLRLTLHPAARLVRAAFPIAAIWGTHQSPNADIPPVNLSQGEDVLITRPQHELIARTLTAADATFVSHIGAGAPLGAAVGAAVEADGNFSLQSALQLHLMNGTFAALDV